MATITISDTGMDIPNSHCDQCDINFGLIWQRNPVYDGIQFCPFCGEEVEEIIDELNEGVEWTDEDS